MILMLPKRKQCDVKQQQQRNKNKTEGVIKQQTRNFARLRKILVFVIKLKDERAVVVHSGGDDDGVRGACRVWSAQGGCALGTGE